MIGKARGYGDPSTVPQIGLAALEGAGQLVSLRPMGASLPQCGASYGEPGKESGKTVVQGPA